MRVYFILLASLFSHGFISQQFQFNTEKVDSIIIRSNLSVYQFDKKGTTKGTDEHLIISFNKKENTYQITGHNKTKYINTFKPEYFKQITRNKLKKKDYILNKSNLDFLISSLQQTESAKEFISKIDTNEFNEHTTKHAILAIAKNYKVKWSFKRKYSSEKENLLIYNGLQTKDSLELFLSEQLNLNYTYVTDYNNAIEILVKTNLNSYQFLGRYPNTIKQPWYTSINNSTGNLNINKALESLLPKAFLLKESISLKKLYNQYIVWYLKRQRIIH